MTKLNIYLIVTLAVVAIVAADYVGWSNGSERHWKAAAKARVNEIYAAGIVEGLTDEIQLKTEKAGRIAKISVVEGEWVHQGDLLIELANDDLRYQVELSTANLNRAKAELEKLYNGARSLERDELTSLYQAGLAEYQRAEKAWQRIKRLEESNAIAAGELDHHFFQLNRLRSEVAAAKSRLDLIQSDPRREDVQIAQSSVANAQAQLNAARTEFEKTRLLAPCRGQILELNVREGETTGRDAMEPVLVMADTSQLFVVAYLEEYDAMRVNANCRARIAAAGLGADVYGQVESLSPMMGRKEIASLQPDELHDVRTRKVRIKLDDRVGLIIGLPVDVYFETL